VLVAVFEHLPTSANRVQRTGWTGLDSRTPIIWAVRTPQSVVQLAPKGLPSSEDEIKPRRAVEVR
jgi:hypothetical protein